MQGALGKLVLSPLLNYILTCHFPVWLQFVPFVFAEAVGDLRRDVDLAIVAFSGHQDAYILVRMLLGYSYYNNEAYNETLSFLHDVQLEAKSKIARFELFVKGFLPGMSAHAGPNCHLRMLATGVEVSVALKKTIASFLGMPAGKELPSLRRTVRNLSKLPSYRHTCDCSYCDGLQGDYDYADFIDVNWH